MLANLEGRRRGIAQLLQNAIDARPNLQCLGLVASQLKLRAQLFDFRRLHGKLGPGCVPADLQTFVLDFQQLGQFLGLGL